MSVVICLMCERRDGIMFSATAWNVAVLSPLLGITWLFGVLSVSRQTVVFQYIFAITNTLQVQQHSLLPTRLCIRLDSAVAEGPRDALCMLNLVDCCSQWRFYGGGANRA